ncbi:MAG: hypothetical protein ACK559_37060, partial [bacterium]
MLARHLDRRCESGDEAVDPARRGARGVPRGHGRVGHGEDAEEAVHRVLDHLLVVQEQVAADDRGARRAADQLGALDVGGGAALEGRDLDRLGLAERLRQDGGGGARHVDVLAGEVDALHVAALGQAEHADQPLGLSA